MQYRILRTVLHILKHIEWKKTLQDLHASALTLNPFIADKTTGMALHDTNSFCAALAESIELNTSTFQCTDEPRTWEEALQLVDCDVWRSGYIDELNSLRGWASVSWCHNWKCPRATKFERVIPCSGQNKTKMVSLFNGRFN